MDFPAAMTSPRALTPHVAADPLVCGEFLRQDANYTNWRPHGSGDWLLIYTLSGAGRITTATGSFRLGEGQALLYPPGAMQDYATDPEAGRWSLRWAHFSPKPQWQPWLAWPEAKPGAPRMEFSAAAARRFADALRRMLAASRLEGEGAIELAMNALEEALLWAVRDLAGDRWLTLDSRIRKAVAYLEGDPARPFSLGELARHCGLSSSRLSHLFKQQMQVTPRQFSEKLRLDLASQLLANTGLSVREVAFQAGFDDPLYFSRRFALAFGRTPGEARGGRGRLKD
jgi:AraC family transcriptional regulator of arabinose operon